MRWLVGALSSPFSPSLRKAPFAASRSAPLPVQEIAPGVFVHTGEIALMSEENLGDIANIGFVIGDKGVAVIDTGGSVPVGERLLAAIRARTNKPILYVINTHEHPDHVFGNAAFEGLGATFVGHHNLPRALGDARRILSQGVSPDHWRQARRSGEDHSADLDRRRSDDARSRRKDARIAGLAAGAHGLRPDRAGYDDADAVRRRPRLCQAPADHRRLVEGLAGRSSPRWRRVPAVRVIPGHGPVGLPWPQALDSERAYFERIAKDVKTSIAKGEPVEAAEKWAGQSQRDDWRLFDDYNRRNVTAAYSEFEWDQ